MMKSLMPWRKKRNEVAKGDMVPADDFAFPLSRMRDEFDRLFERMAREFSIFEEDGEGWRWGLDVEDKEDKVIVRAEAPGFEANDFDVRVEDSRLILEASKKVETKDDKGNVQKTQQRQCYEMVALPVGIDKDTVDAQYHNGVLTVTLPKTPTAKARKIAVKAN